MKSKISCLKPSLIVLLLGFAGTSAYAQAQELKEKKIALSDDIKITYHVNKENIKEGAFYIRQSKPEQLLVKGSYTDNKKSGNWYFYNESGKPETIYSFHQNKLAFIDSALLNKITINLPEQDKEVIENARIPVLLSPIKLLLSELSNSISIPGDHFLVNQPLAIQIKAAIDVNGESKYYVTYKHNGRNIEQQVKLKKSAFEIGWIPASYNAKPIKSEYIVNTAINNPAESEDGHRRFQWNY